MSDYVWTYDLEDDDGLSAHITITTDITPFGYANEGTNAPYYVPMNISGDWDGSPINGLSNTDRAGDQRLYPSSGEAVVNGGGGGSDYVNDGLDSDGLEFQDAAGDSIDIVSNGDVPAGQDPLTAVVYPDGRTNVPTDNYSLAATFTTTAPSMAPCYRAGTRISTPSGETAVEDLAIGDFVATASGAIRPIRWIGHRSYNGRFIAGNVDVLPIVIRAGALADNNPTRDLSVSPKHAMFLDGVLIPAALLVNGVTVVQAEAVEELTYYHVELDRHDVLLAEGAPSESFADHDSRMIFHNAQEFLDRHGQISASPDCAPRVEDGAVLAAVRRRIAARACLAADHAADAASHGALDGRVDVLDHQHVSGWAFDATRPHTPVGLEVLIDGQSVATCVANTFRADLCVAGKGRGHCAFALRLVEPMAPDVDHQVSVRRIEDGALLPGGHATVSADPQEPGSLEGQIDHCNGVTVEGWAFDIAWPDLPVRLEILDGHQMIGQVVADRHRQDLALAGKGHGNCSFVYRFPAPPRHAALIRVRRASDGVELTSSIDWSAAA